MTQNCTNGCRIIKSFTSQLNYEQFEMFNYNSLKCIITGIF